VRIASDITGRHRVIVRDDAEQVAHLAFEAAGRE
jgi:hypothetical protein